MGASRPESKGTDSPERSRPAHPQGLARGPILTPYLQDGKMIHLCGFKSVNVWRLVIADLGRGDQHSTIACKTLWGPHTSIIGPAGPPSSAQVPHCGSHLLPGT